MILSPIGDNITPPPGAGMNDEVVIEVNRKVDETDYRKDSRHHYHKSELHNFRIHGNG